MKLKILAIGLLIAITVSGTAAPQADYSRIKKDLSVMAQIVKSAFKDDASCENCQVKISTNYLAEQGAIFTITDFRQFYGFTFSDGDRNAQVEEALQSIEFIPDMVGDILVDVGASLEETGARIEIFRDDDEWGHDGDHDRIDRSARNSVRQLGRETRELEYQVREHEIALLHSEEESERKELETSIKQLEAEIEKLTQKREQFNQEYETAKQDRVRQRRERRAKIAQRDSQRLAQAQSIIMQTFCDYGSTLKNLPDDERVSIIFKRRQEGNDSIFIFDKAQVTDCDSNGDQLKAKAFAYTY